MVTNKNKIARLNEIRQKALVMMKELHQHRHDPLYREEYLTLKKTVDLANEKINELY